MQQNTVRDIGFGCLEEDVWINDRQHKLRYSMEALQDMHAMKAIFDHSKHHISEPTEEEIEIWRRYQEALPFHAMCRTPEPTKEEIKDWQYLHEKFKKIDFNQIRAKYKIKFLDQQEPYKEEEPWFLYY